MLLRCLDKARFELPDGRALTVDELARQLPAAALHAAELQLLLPAARCLLTTVPVTRHEERLLHRTLPWLLEERLLQAAEQLHVTHGPVHSGQTPVAAIDSAWLQEVLDALAAKGLGAQSAASELLYLPWQPDQWTIVVQAAPAACLVRHGEHAGFACSAANLNTALQLLLNESAAPPAQVLLYDVAGNAASAALVPVLLQNRVVVKQSSYWDAVKAGGQPALMCNVLQRRFATRLPWLRLWQQWRIAALLLVGLWLADIGITAAESIALQQQIADNEAAIIERYRRVQPEGNVVDARLQLEQAIVAIGGSAHPGFLDLLHRMRPALADVPQARVESFDYNGTTGELLFTVQTSGFDVAEDLRRRLQALGLDAELLGSISEGTNSRTRLKVGG